MPSSAQATCHPAMSSAQKQFILKIAIETTSILEVMLPGRILQGTNCPVQVACSTQYKSYTIGCFVHQRSCRFLYLWRTFFLCCFKEHVSKNLFKLLLPSPLYVCFYKWPPHACKEMEITLRRMRDCRSATLKTLPLLWKSRKADYFYRMIGLPEMEIARSAELAPLGQQFIVRSTGAAE
jgi:hypothetical protein